MTVRIGAGGGAADAAPRGPGVRIGLEVHVPLPTRSKLFCPCPLPARDAAPNTAICPTCLGHPGSKPRPNRRALEFALRLAKALGCTIPESMRFARKTYFYPDMGKNFQITQYESPVGRDGALDAPFGAVRIRRVQVEEDPARIVHAGQGGAAFTLLDYNRSGAPLAEVVTEPDMGSPEEARAFLAGFRAVLDAVGIPAEDANLRADCNVSTDGGARVEVKNVMGLRNAERALAYEVRRQRALRGKGLAVAQATMHFDEATGTTSVARLKETEEDYGYIVEPDLPAYPAAEMAAPLEVPELPLLRTRRLAQRFGLPEDLVRPVVADAALAAVAERLAERREPRLVFRWLGQEVRPLLEGGRERGTLEAGLGELLALLAAKRVGEPEAKRLTKELVATGRLGEARQLATDTAALDAAIRETLAANPRALEDARRDERAMNFLVGQVMRRTKGAYDARLVLERCRAAAR